VKVLDSLLTQYIEEIGLDCFNEFYHCTQIVVKQDKTDISMEDKNNFEKRGMKAGKNIYINTALLSAFNQFDYYLRHELRYHSV